MQQLQLQLAQTTHAFDQLMQKYQNSRNRERTLLEKVDRQQAQLQNFKALFEEANIRYEKLKKSAEAEIQMAKMACVGVPQDEFLALRRENDKLRADKQQLSDVVRKLMVKCQQR